MSIESFLTPSQVAGILRVSRRTLTRFVSDGILTPVRIRGTVRFNPADVREVLQLGGHDSGKLPCGCVICRCYE
jgi:excisionase family DNA binding protein